MSRYEALPDWPFQDRGELIVQLVRSGMTGAAVGAKLGVTRERVRQVWTEKTGTPLPTHERQLEQTRAAELARLRRCVSCRTDYPGPRAEHERTEVHVRSKAANVAARYERTKARLRAYYHRLHPNARHYKPRTAK